MTVILITLLCTALFPINSIAFQFVWDIVFGKGGHIPRVRNIETARSLHRYAILDFIGLVERHGYSAEEHNLTTDDGYNLRIHRISGSPSNPKIKGKPVAYLQHGILASSDNFVLMGPGRDLAFLLADAGYDVWLGNHRGNTYSRSHKKFSADRDPKFWKFSYHEIAIYDLANTIDYILNETGEKSLIYVGHSMGTTMSFVLLSTKPEYNDKIKLNVCLAPIAFWKHKPSQIFQLVIKYGHLMQTILERNELNEILPLTETSARTGTALCSEISAMQPLCINLFFQISGYNLEQLNTKSMPYILSYFPAGTSAQILIHYYQNIVSGEFQAFDFGGENNFLYYGQEKAPTYNLKNIRTPVALIYGEGDLLSTRLDVEELYKHLPNVLTFESVPHKNFSHLDFLWAKSIKPLLNNRVLQIIEKFSLQPEIEYENAIPYAYSY